ncbi:MAG: dienelactone hydrolase family protein [Actinophytocola sp.]|uniref:dienelactone hydrolase family protein n=1 Tax=Actinophytocola sp. TaxID=1872138 RepID=UPI003C7586D9
MTQIEIPPRAEGSQRLHGYLARPAGDGPWPGVVLVHEVWGLDGEMRKHADRLARSGYLTLAPDLYSQGGARWCLAATLAAMSSGKGKAFADIEAARTWLAASDDCTGRVGAIGFCMGGGFVLLTVHTMAAVSANYGMLPRKPDEAMAGACPVLASYGARDRMLRGAPGKLSDALERAGVVHDVEVYPNAGHSFLNEEESGPRWLRPLLRASHSGPEPESAALEWRRIEAFFAEHLGADGTP